jgi:hypothetical protein
MWQVLWWDSVFLSHARLAAAEENITIPLAGWFNATGGLLVPAGAVG